MKFIRIYESIIIEKTVCTLLYAADIVLFAENEEYLQHLIEHFHKWCKRPVSLFKFSYEKLDLEIVKTYNYSGVKFDENLNFRDCIKARSDAASRAFGGIVSKCKQYSDVGYNNFCHLFDSFVAPVQEYACKIWWKSSINVCDKITERAILFFSPTHNFYWQVSAIGRTM